MLKMKSQSFTDGLSIANQNPAPSTLKKQNPTLTIFKLHIVKVLHIILIHIKTEPIVNYLLIDTGIATGHNTLMEYTVHLVNLNTIIWEPFNQ